MTKYVDLQIECQRMGDKTVEIVLIIITATGVVKKNLKKYPNRILGCHNVYNLQKSAILGTAHILRKVLPIKPEKTAQRTTNHVKPRCGVHTS